MGPIQWAGGRVPLILTWPGLFETNHLPKASSGIATCELYPTHRYNRYKYKLNPGPLSNPMSLLFPWYLGEDLQLSTEVE